MQGNMIKGLTIENMKSIKNIIHIDFTDVCLFIGENGSGKSTVLQTLSLIKQNYSKIRLDEGNYVRLGDFSKIAGNTKAPIKIIISGNIKPEDVEPFSYLSDLDYEFAFNYKDNQIEYISLRLSANKLSEMLKSKIGLKSNIIFYVERKKGDPATTNNNSFFYHPVLDQMFQPIAYSISNANPFNLNPELFMSGHNTRLSNEMWQTVNNTINSINIELRKDLTDRVVMVPALRGIDTSEYRLLEKRTNEFVDAFNFRRQAELLVSSLEFRREYADRISGAIEAILGRKTRTRLVDGPIVLVETYNGEKWVNIMNEGFGVNPLVHLIFQTIVAPNNSLVLIEEPEIHLYPAAQKRLAEQLIKIAKEDGKHLVITSHSENILLSLIYQSRQSDMKDRIQICFFQRDPEKKSSEMIIVTDGNMGKLFRNFFATNLHEITNLQELLGL